MAKDYSGREQERSKCRTTGKPLKLMTQPATQEYRDGWERTFGKPARARQKREREFTKKMQQKASYLYGQGSGS